MRALEDWTPVEVALTVVGGAVLVSGAIVGMVFGLQALLGGLLGGFLSLAVVLVALFYVIVKAESWHAAEHEQGHR